MNSLNQRLHNAATLVVMCAALVMVGVFFQDRRAAGAADSVSVRDLVPHWMEALEHGIIMGPDDADVVITKFMDFQCPYCSAFGLRLDSIMQDYSNVTVVFHHYPLRQHEHALAAAVAAECAHRQGSFKEFAAILYEKRLLLGEAPWSTFGEWSGIAEIDEFVRCTKLPVESFVRITTGLELGRRSGVRGTPTVWVNDKVAARLDAGSLIQLIENELASSRRKATRKSLRRAVNFTATG